MTSASDAPAPAPGGAPARLQPRQRLIPWAVAALMLLGIGLGLYLGVRQRLAPPVAGEGASPIDLVVSASGSRTITFTFRTAVPTRWTAASSAGDSVTEPAESRMHALVMPVLPWQLPDSLELSCGSRRIAVTPPPGPRARIRRLGAAIRAARLDLKATDRVYDAIRRDFRGWNTVDPSTATAARAAQELGDRPELAGPLMAMIAGAREALDALAPVRGLVAEALTSVDTPAAVQEELLEALGRLDHLDALAGYFGQAAPAGVQALLAPILDVRVVRLPALPAKPPPKAGACAMYEPTASHGVALFLPHEDVTRAGGLVQELALQRIPGLQDVDAGSVLALRPCVKPGPRGYKLVLVLSSFPAGLYLWLFTGRAASGLPVRLEPAQDAGVYAELELTVRIPAALVVPGRDWKLTQRRLFMTASRIYFIVRRAELLPD